MSKSATVGLDQIYYAIMNDDTLETYDTPVRLAGAIQAGLTPTTNSATLYADDQASEVATSLGDIALVLNVKDISTVDQAALLGHTIDANGVLVRSKDDIAPYVALGYRRRKADGTFRYIWNLKGKFQAESQDAQTKTDTPAFQTPTINATFIPRATDGQWQSVVNEGDAGVVAGTLTNWFNTVYLENADTIAPTVTIVPANAAIGVAVGVAVVWTFNEAIQAATAVPANFHVIADVAGTTVAGALTINAANTIVTFTPTANLTAATAYRAIATVGVKDLAGNALATNSVTKFTTA